MKKKELLKKLSEMGCVFVKHGANHDWYTNPVTKMHQAVPRHNEIHEGTAKTIIKKLS
jgi:predicted RNA binding protein YcfA (HicA-like mRNA interferase family)